MNTLSSLVDQALPSRVEPVEVDQHVLDSVIGRLLGDDVVATEAPFYTDTCLREFGGGASGLEARSGGWVFHLRRSVAQSTLSGVVMAILLKGVTASPLSLFLIPAILPYIFQVEKTLLSMKDEELLLHLHMNTQAQGLSADVLYELLPENIRDGVNRIDMLEFLEAVVATGHAHEVERGIFTLRHPDRPKFVVQIR